MKLILGLGNPGKEYAQNRHNVGFMLVDKLQKKWDFPAFEFNKKFNAEISEGLFDMSLRAERSKPEINHEIATSSRDETPRNDSKNKILLAKPQTFMNASGEAVQKIMSFYKITPADLVVIHDDLDIEIGNYKIQKDVHSVGHNGVESIINRLGTQDFTRVRVGVEKQGGRKERSIPGEDFVLQDFTLDELEKITTLSGAIALDIQKLLI